MLSRAGIVVFSSEAKDFSRGDKMMILYFIHSKLRKQPFC